MHRVAEFCSLREQLTEAVRDLRVDSKLSTVMIKEHFLNLQLDKQISQKNVEDLSRRLTCLSSLLAELGTETRKIGTEQLVLKSLTFDRLRARVDQIVDAHRDTFHWIFDDEIKTDSRIVSFINWFTSGDGVWWITGRAGSGKSTLVKHISNNSKAEKLLEVWAADRGKKLVTASYYFWNAGTKLQRSQEGLLRSLLYDVLRQCPDEITSVCRSKIGQFHLFHTDHSPWSRRELLEAFEQLSKESHGQASYCFFIDGLDEYDCVDEGTHQDLVQLLQYISQAKAVKLCISSRDYTVFRDAFVEGRHLMMQDLTEDDIKTFVRANLQENARFRVLEAEDDRYPALEQAIVREAHGVFLWVFLVVRSLKEGLTNADRVSDLQKRLNELPKTLEDFFAHMLYSVDKRYQGMAAQAFQIANQAAKPLELVIYSFLDEEDPDFALKLPIQPLTDEQIESRHEDMRKRLNARCRGLLEINRSISYATYGGRTLLHTVDFLHRTVRDYLFNTPDMQNLLQSRLPEGYSPQYELSKAFLAQMKCVQLRKHSGLFKSSMGTVRCLEPNAPDSPFRQALNNFLLFAEEFTVRCHQQPTALLLEAERTLLERPGQRARRKKTAFLGACADYSLDWYVAHRIKENHQLVKHQGCPLLYYALNLPEHHGQSADHTEDRSLRPELIKLLLENDADPNQRYKDQTIWARFLSQLIQDARPPSAAVRAPLITSIGLLIHYGANLDQDVVVKREFRPRRLKTGRSADLYGAREVEVVTTKTAHELLSQSFTRDELREIWAQSPEAKSTIRKLFSWIAL